MKTKTQKNGKLSEETTDTFGKFYGTSVRTDNVRQALA